MSADKAPLDKKPPAPAADIRIALARAQVETEWTARRLRRGMSKGFCLFFTLLALSAGLGGIFYWGWVDKPEPRIYEPATLHHPAQTARLGKGWSIQLPATWHEKGFLAFAGDSGAELAVVHGTLKLLHMMPKAWRGEETGVVYTSVAYATGLRQRYPGLGEILVSNYVKLGAHEGVEAWLAMADGRVLRAFALVLDAQRVLELRFYLPGNKNTSAWAEAESIFRSLCYSAPGNKEN